MRSTFHSPSYLVKEPYSYYFRMKVPVDLRGIMTRKELRYSLRTCNLAVAKNKARYIAGQVQQLFRDVQTGCFDKMNLSKDQIHKMVKKFMQKRIEKYNTPIAYKNYVDELSLEDEWDPNWRADDERAYSPFNDLEGLEDTIDFIDEITNDLNLKLQTGNYDLAADRADRLLKEEGYVDSDIDKTSHLYAELCSGVYRAWIKSLEFWKQKLSGKFSDELEVVLNDNLSGNHALPQTIQQELKITQPEQKLVQSSPTISQVMVEFFLWGKEEEIWDEKTKGTIQSSLNLLMQFFGDIPVNSITRTMMLDYRKALWKLPPNINKNKKFKGKDIHQIIAEKHEKTIASHTYNGYMGRTIKFLDFAVQTEVIDKNPALDLKKKINKRNADARKIFDAEDLKNLFHSEQYRKDKFKMPYQFWMPILALFTGARLNEIAQLHLSDFEQHEEIWCININKGTEDKKLKNDSSHRLIPLHSLLVEELNIIQRVENLKRQEKKRFFPELSLGRDGYGKNVSRWFNQTYKQSCGITKESKKVFHSFRHTFSTNLAHNNINDHSLKALMGHAEDSVTFDTYVKRGTPTKLYNDLEQHLDFNLDLSHLKNSKFVVK